MLLLRIKRCLTIAQERAVKQGALLSKSGHLWPNRPMNSSTPAPYALILVDLVTQSGVDRGALLADTSLAEGGVASVGARLPDADFRQLVLNALSLTGDVTLGLRLGERLNLSAHAVLGQAFMTCNNLREVIELFERYYHLLAPDLELEFGETDEMYEVIAKNTQAELPMEFGLECISAALRNTLIGLLGREEFPIRFEFPYPKPAYANRYFEVLGDDVHFDQPQMKWTFPASLLDATLPSSNQALHDLYESECARLLADLRDDIDLNTQTRRLLQKFEGQYPKMPQIASMLNMSARTYRRRLAEEGTSFQTVLDGVRVEHATRHLREGRLPIASIAYHLGFSDPSNFRRAYLRWTGKTPGQVKRGAEL